MKKAIGAEVMRAIASAKAAAVSGASMDGSGSASVASRSAFNDLVGTETTGGILQVNTREAREGHRRNYYCTAVLLLWCCVGRPLVLVIFLVVDATLRFSSCGITLFPVKSIPVLQAGVVGGNGS